MDDNTLNEVRNIYARAKLRSEAVGIMERLNAEGLRQYITPQEAQTIAIVDQEVRSMVGGAIHAAIPAPASTPAPAPVPAAPPPVTPVQPAVAAPPPVTAASIPADIDQRFWDVPSWGKPIVMAQPPEDRDTMIMDILNTIDSAGEARAKEICERLYAKKVTPAQRMSATADELTQPHQGG